MKYLKDAGIADGGKAYGLARLIAGGFNVPDGFVVEYDDIADILNGNTDELEKYLAVFPEGSELAVRSSASGEDGENNSFAGIFDTVLNVECSVAAVSDALKKVNASSCGSRADAYDERGTHKMNIVVQQMIDPLLAGVAFSDAVDENGESVIRIEAVEGLGEKLVSGRSSASVVTVSKKSLSDGEPVLRIRGKALDYSRFSELAVNVNRISEFLGHDADVEWCIDKNGKVRFVQARPVTRKYMISHDDSSCIVASDGYASGTVFMVDDSWDEEQTLDQLEKLPENAVLVAWATDTRHMPLMRKAAAVITEEGTALSHAAIISREFGIPCITGYRNAKKLFASGDKIIIDTSEGSVTHNGEKLFFARRKFLRFADLYDFENIIEVSTEKNKVQFQPSFDGVIMYIPYNSSAEDEEMYEITARKLFGQKPLRSSIDKYEWYVLYRQFRKLPFFDPLCAELKRFCEELDSEAVSMFYERTVSLLKTMVTEKESYSEYDRVTAEEMMLSLHLITDMLLPGGYAAKTVFYKCFSTMNELGISFDEMLEGKYPDDCDKKQELDQAAEFMNCVSVLRNEISGRLMAVGALHYDDTRSRHTRTKKALESAGYSDVDAKKAPEIFYSDLRMSEKTAALSDAILRLTDK